MEVWVLVILLLIFGLFEFAASFCFNYKIKMIDQKKFTYGAALGACSTILFMTMTLISPMVASSAGVWFIFAGSAMMAIGNVSALLLLRPFENWLAKRKEEKGVENA